MNDRFKLENILGPILWWGLLLGMFPGIPIVYFWQLWIIANGG